MFKVKMTFVDSDDVLELQTKNRSVARAMAMIAKENSDIIAVSVDVEVKARTVKFKGVD